MNQNALNTRKRLVIWLVVWLVIAVALMVVGHWAVLSSHALFDPSTGTYFTLWAQRISDYAAKWPEGLWIKCSIGAFCAALAAFFGLLITDAASTTRKLWWGLLGAGMIVGLALVAGFNVYPGYFVFHRAYFYLFGKGWVEKLPLSPGETLKGTWHKLGFGMVVGGFFLAAVSRLLQEWRTGGLRAAWPSIAFLLVALGLTGCFFFGPACVGLVQRALLASMLVWMIRVTRALTTSPVGGQPGTVAAGMAVPFPQRRLTVRSGN